MRLASFAFSPLLAAIGLTRPKVPKPGQQPIPTRDDARAAIDANDELARRRGGAADILSGARGVEAPPGGKATLGS